MKKPILLCVDCEGSRDQLDRLLRAFDRAAVPVNFFFVGETARAHPDFVREVAARGHQIESHTATHPNLRSLGAEAQRREILDGRAAVEDIVQRPARGFRAPMHCLNRTTVRILEEEEFLFDASNLYFRYNMGSLIEVPPTWFREWMPFYRMMGIGPSGSFRLFKLLARLARLPVLPAHPHYAGQSDDFADALGDFLIWARNSGFEWMTFEQLFAMEPARLITYLGYQAFMTGRLGEQPA